MGNTRFRLLKESIILIFYFKIFIYFKDKVSCYKINCILLFYHLNILYTYINFVFCVELHTLHFVTACYYIYIKNCIGFGSLVGKSGRQWEATTSQCFKITREKDVTFPFKILRY
jgi:hypothetical protein